MKTETREVTPQVLMLLLNQGKELTNVKFVDSYRHPSDVYEITMEVEPTVEELLYELKKITDMGRTYGKFTSIAEYVEADDLVNGIMEKL